MEEESKPWYQRYMWFVVHRTPDKQTLFSYQVQTVYSNEVDTVSRYIIIGLAVMFLMPSGDTAAAGGAGALAEQHRLSVHFLTHLLFQARVPQQQQQRRRRLLEAQWQLFFCCRALVPPELELQPEYRSKIAKIECFGNSIEFRVRRRT